LKDRLVEIAAHNVLRSLGEIYLCANVLSR
jgi:hypothetical protein